MFCLLTGRSVHDAKTVNEHLAAAITRPAPPLLSIAPEVRPTIANVVDRALEFSKEMRWPDAAQMQAALRLAYNEIHGHSIARAPKIVLGREVPTARCGAARGRDHRTRAFPRPAGRSRRRAGPPRSACPSVRSLRSADC